MKLIINADDFGTTKAVTDGIIDSINNGVVTDTSILVNSPFFDYAIEQARIHGIKEMGLHLNLTYRKPVSFAKDVPSLVNEKGNFYKSWKDIPKNFSIKEVEKEFRSQIEKFHSSGLVLNHLDSHHHIHRIMGSEIEELFVKLALELQVPVRQIKDYENKMNNKKKLLSTKYFNDQFGGTLDRSSEDQLLKILEQYKEKSGTLELMSHPGYCDSDLSELSSWTSVREEEIKSLCSPRIRQYLDENDFELISFSDL